MACVSFTVVTCSTTAQPLLAELRSFLVSHGFSAMARFEAASKLVRLACRAAAAAPIRFG